MWMCFLIGLHAITKVYGFSDTPFPQSCESMSPIHAKENWQPFAPQNTEPPYEIYFETGQRQEEPVTVVLKGKQSTAFTGYLLEARARDAVSKGPPVGKFIILNSDDTQLMTCSGSEDSAAFQVNSREKTLVKVNWTTPKAGKDITFRATFIQSYDVFWEGVEINFTYYSSNNTSKPLAITTSTPKPSTTNTPKPSITRILNPSTNGPKPSTTTSTRKPSTTNTPKPSITSILNPSTNAPKPSTTTSTPKPSTTSSLKPNSVKQAMTAEEGTIIMMMIASSFLEIFKMIIAVFNSYFFLTLDKALKSLCGVLCAAAETVALVLICMGDSFDIILAALVCVVIAINFIEQVFVFLPFGPSGELSEICEPADLACSVIHLICIITIIFVGAWRFDDFTQVWRESWYLNVMVAYAVWIFLFTLWVIVFRTYRKQILRRSRKGKTNQSRASCISVFLKKRGAVEVSVIAVSVIVLVGTLSFDTAIIVGMFGSPGK